MLLEQLRILYCMDYITWLKVTKLDEMYFADKCLEIWDSYKNNLALCLMESLDEKVVARLEEYAESKIYK